MDKPDGKHKLLEQVDPHRRDFARRMLSGAAFVAPLIATFSIDGLTVTWIARQDRAEPGGSAQA
jgi:hypothetical protein